MSEKSLETKFNKALDEYIMGGENGQSASFEEDQELLAIGKELWDEDVCSDIDEEKLRSRFMNCLKEEKENVKMKNRSFKKKIVALGLVAVLGGGFSQTALGQNVLSGVIARFTTGHGTVLQYDPNEEKENEPELIPAEYKGKLFDTNGKELEYFPNPEDGMYNAKGEVVMCIKEGKVYTEEEWNEYYGKEMEEEGYTKITDTSKMSDYTCFKVEMPEYLPEGIKFDHAGVWSKEDVKDNQCIEVIFNGSDGKQAIYMQQRKACEEAGYETGTSDTIQEVDINGVKGLMYDNSLDWETDEVIYMLMSTSDNVSREDMLKVARSIAN